MSVRNEPDVVIACGCITTPMGAVKEIGGKEEQLCPGEHGWQKILREATLYERFAYHEFGTSAPKRRNRSTSKRLLAMSGGSSETKRSRPANEVLF